MSGHRRGPKPYEPGLKVMPIAEIAKRIGVSTRTVQADYDRAVRKLKRQEGAFPILLACVRAVAEEKQRDERELIRPASVECNREYRELYGEGN